MTEKEIFIVLTDHNAVRKSDAIVLLEGDGYNRIQKTIDLYKSGVSDTIVFSGNIINESYGSFPYERIAPMLQKAGIPENDILYEDKSTNTLEQAIEVIQLAKKSGWERIILVASHYHQYRAFLTFLKQQQLNLPNLIIYNCPANDLPWFEQNNWGKRIDLLADEFKKIEIYKLNNHLATYKEAIQYYKWREEQI